jgi:hypothetical protein
VAEEHEEELQARDEQWRENEERWRRRDEEWARHEASMRDLREVSNQTSQAVTEFVRELRELRRNFEAYLIRRPQ